MRIYSIENVEKKAINGEWEYSYDVMFDSPSEMVHYILAQEVRVDIENNHVVVTELIDPSGNNLFNDFMKEAKDISEKDELWIRVRANGSADIFGN